MDLNLSNPTWLQLIVILGLIFLIWHFLHRLIFGESFCWPANRLTESLVRRISGFFFLGLLAYLVAMRLGFTSANLGLDYLTNPSAKYYILTSFPIILLLMIFIGPKKENLWIRPIIRCRRWSWTLVLISSLSWLIYLTASEFFFRGFLLFPLIESIGWSWAVTINMIFYLLTFSGQGKIRMLAAAILSFILSRITYHTGSIYIAIVIQLILVLSNEWISLYYNPDMKVKGWI